MDESAISVRYAKAVFTLSLEKNKLQSLKNDMEIIYSACKDSSDFNLLLKSPVVKTSEKIKLLNLIFENRIDSLTQNFLTLITQNKRELFIPAISRNVLEFIRKEKNIKSAVLTTAGKIDHSIINKIQKILEKELGGEVELAQKVNPKIIGGLILRIDDKQYDGSVATQLKKVKQEFIKSQV